MTIHAAAASVVQVPSPIAPSNNEESLMPHPTIVLIALALSLAPIAAVGGGLLGDALRAIDKSVLDAGKSLGKAQQEVGRAAENAVSTSAIDDVRRAQLAIREAEVKQRDVERRFAELTAVSAQVEKDKAALEAREKLFSMGFYASFTTTLIAIFGLVVKLPTSKLEKRLKLLEIQEKEIAIKERVERLEGKPALTFIETPRDQG